MSYIPSVAILPTYLSLIRVCSLRTSRESKDPKETVTTLQ
jgi:hypothetical protein